MTLSDATLPPVIAISGLAGSADHLRSEAAGFLGQLDKPFDERRLFVAIETAIGRRVPTTPSAPPVRECRRFRGSVCARSTCKL